ncbi:MAG: ABC transporter permease [Phototrophicaceae bacterium]
MSQPIPNLSRILWLSLALIAAAALTAGLILFTGRNPVEVFQTIWEGAFRDSTRVAGVVNFFIPLALTSLGLVVTFRAGLWNIGVEGQMMAGAVCASGVALFFDAPGFVRVPAALIAAALGGMAWAWLVGVLKIYLGVHEIFGGVALNAIINVFTNYLVGTLWSPPGGNALDTGPFDDVARLTVFESARFDFPTNLPMLGITILAAVAVTIALQGTRWGLQLKATGKNPRSALLLGVPTERVSLSAFMVCGALAGLAGAYRVLFTFGTLRPLVSSGIGFLGILVVLLVSQQAVWVILVAFAFAALLSGSTRLRVTMQLDASLAQVLQGVLVLLVLLSDGLRARLGRNREM